MNPAISELPEDGIQIAAQSGDFKTAATLIMQAYGREIFTFLNARLRDRELTADVFGDFTEDLWRGLATFRWQCSARAWAYTLARHAASRGVRKARRRGARNVPLSRAGPLSEIAERIRTETSLEQRTSQQHKMSELRERLSPLEQTLLSLRVNRCLPWRDIARIVSSGSLEAALAMSSDELDTEAARLRKRFQKAKEKLRRLAEEAGLIRE